MHLYEVLRRPLITEKNTNLQAAGKYVFEVADKATKFQVQQAVEKAIKAVLTAAGVEYPLTHNLGALLDLLRDRGAALPPDSAKLPVLTPFGVMLRYPDYRDVDEPEVLDRSWVKQAIERTLQWAQLLG